MTRVKILKDYDMHRAGETKEVTPNIAHGLIDRGVAEISKDITAQETVVKVAKPTVKIKKKRTRKFKR